MQKLILCFLLIFYSLFLFCKNKGEILLQNDKKITNDEKNVIIGQDKEVYSFKDSDFLEDYVPPPNCKDKDLDQYGEGNCPKGEDCDDNNPYFNKFCPDCSLSHYKGCPCNGDIPSEECFEGDMSLVGIGLCQSGTRYCEIGYWSECKGQVLPSDEICDGKDNNCDGVIDDGVLSPCGDCNQNCDILKIGPDEDEKFNPTEENSDSVELNENDYLVLSIKQKKHHSIWIANSAENTVSRLDTKTGWEVGRYYTCNDPSRTAVDLDGNVWVGCRADGGVAKIVVWEEECVDKNGNGKIDTSKDINGNHVIDGSEILPWGQDECVKFIVYPDGKGGFNSPNGCARAAGVDKENHAWVGFWGSKTIKRLEPKNGAVVQSIPLPGKPYGLAIDKNGIIWISGGWGTNDLMKVDPKTGKIWDFQWPASGTPYGIAIDIEGKVWLASHATNCGAVKFDPLTLQWSPHINSGLSKNGRGITSSVDGYVWVACDSANKVAKIDIKTNKVVNTIKVGNFPIGMAVDFDGFIWAINNGSSSASKIDGKGGQVVGEYPTGKAPYTYSDMTGYALHTVTAPKGYYQHTFGDFETERMLWEELTVIADTPPQTYIKVRLRSDNDVIILKMKEWSQYYGPYPPWVFPLNLFTVPNLDGKFLQVEVSLYSSDLKNTPVVKAIIVKVTKEKK